jgi:hypothetical protein
VLLSIDENLWPANNNYGILRQKHKSKGRRLISVEQQQKGLAFCANNVTEFAVL